MGSILFYDLQSVVFVFIIFVVRFLVIELDFALANDLVHDTA